MNQNPFASFFSPEAGGYPQLPDPLVANGYMDARTGLMVKDDSLHTSTLSHDSQDSDSSPSTPSKSKKSDQHRTPKSKAEVSERMRRWRSENAEKNRLNDLRCRVYRQARIRFGKDPTPEREAWIQSEIFRRLERRRLREAMKGNGSVPAPTAMTSPTSMAMSIGGHPAGGPITRSRSTVHPFPIHMNGQSGVPDHAMNFPATPYAMMAGAGMYDSSQQQYGHGAHSHHSHQHQHQHQQQQQQQHQQNHVSAHHQHMGHQQMGLSHQNNGYMTQTQGYGNSQGQQHQSSQPQPQQHGQYGHSSQHQSDHQLASNFISGAPNALPSADLYSSFKFINPLYPGRILPHQASGSLASAHTGVQHFYGSQQHHHHSQQQQQQQAQPQQPQSHYLGHQQPQQQPQQQHSSMHPPQQQGTHGSTGQTGVTGQLGTHHSVPSNQPSQSQTANSVDAATAAAVAAVADFSNSFQLPQSSSQAMYSYYQDSAPAWETSVSSAELSHNGQTNSSPATPAETIAPAPSQYTLHAVDSSMYSIVSSDAPTSANAPANVRGISSLNMVNPISGSSLGRTLVDSETTDGIASTGGVDVASTGNESYSAASDLTAVAAAAAAVSAQPSSANYLYGYAGQTTSPSLNDVASNLFSLRQISQNNSTGVNGSGDSAINVKPQQGSVLGTHEEQMSGSVGASELPQTADSAVGFSSGHVQDTEGGNNAGDAGRVIDNQDSAEQSADASHQNQSLVQVPFNLNVVSDNLQF